MRTLADELRREDARLSLRMLGRKLGGKPYTFEEAQEIARKASALIFDAMDYADLHPEDRPMQECVRCGHGRSEHRLDVLQWCQNCSCGGFYHNPQAAAR